jgi:hypothetical protein
VRNRQWRASLRARLRRRDADDLTGTVVKVLWQNPHAYIDLDVAMDGTRARWIVENEGSVALEAARLDESRRCEPAIPSP